MYVYIYIYTYTYVCIHRYIVKGWLFVWSFVLLLVSCVYVWFVFLLYLYPWVNPSTLTIYLTHYRTN